MQDRKDLEAIFRAGVAACHPSRVLAPHLPPPPKGRTILLALGKAALGMAREVVRRWQGPLTGLVVAPHGVTEELATLSFMTAGHPVPDRASVEAAERLLALAGEADEDDLVLVLLSGGASALACLPGEGLSLEEKQVLTQALLRSGAPIEDINIVRRHLSRIKGGRLVEAARPARLVTLAISDVTSGRPEDLGSGPTVADPTSLDDTRAILRRHGIEAPAAGWTESVKQVEGEYRIVAGGRDAVEAAAAKAAELGYVPHVLSHDCTGEARQLGVAHARLALDAKGPAALISGGELTVTVQGGGSGGPNQEYALALAIGLDGAAGFSALAADTDGRDGSGEAAGAFVDPETLKRAAALGRDPAEALADNDSGTFFAALGDLFLTGPTGTNVNDLRIILVRP